MKPKTEIELDTPRLTGTPQSRRRQAKRKAKEANKNHFTKRNDKDCQSKPKKIIT